MPHCISFRWLRSELCHPLCREVSEGMGKACPLVYDLAANTTVADASCPPNTGDWKELVQLGDGMLAVLGAKAKAACMPAT
jgi:hypothetical protein